MKVTLGYKHDVDWYDHIITWTENGKEIEARSAHESTKADAKETLKSQIKCAEEHGYEVTLTVAAKKLLEYEKRKRRPRITFGKES
jgi:hypothetical protein